MTPITNEFLSDLFYDYAELLDVEKANRFRVAAYRRAALTIRNSEEAFSEKVACGDDLSTLPTIGDDLAAKIQTIVKTDEFPELAALRRSLPKVKVALLQVEGIGPERFRTIEKALGPLTAHRLVRAAQKGQLADLPGIGEQIEPAILYRFQS